MQPVRKCALARGLHSVLILSLVCSDKSKKRSFCAPNFMRGAVVWIFVSVCACATGAASPTAHPARIAILAKVFVITTVELLFRMVMSGNRSALIAVPASQSSGIRENSDFILNYNGNYTAG